MKMTLALGKDYVLPHKVGLLPQKGIPSTWADLDNEVLIVTLFTQF